MCSVQEGELSRGCWSPASFPHPLTSPFPPPRHLATVPCTPVLLHCSTWGQSVGQSMPVRYNLHHRGVRVGGLSTLALPYKVSPGGVCAVAHSRNSLTNTLFLAFPSFFVSLPHSLTTRPGVISKKNHLQPNPYLQAGFWENPKQERRLLNHGGES